MNKQIAMLTAVFALTAGYVMAEQIKMGAPEANANASAMESAKSDVVEVGNKICPLTGRELNLNDPNDFTKLEVEGMSFNVCPKGKAEYDADATKFADKIAAAVATAKAAPAKDMMPSADMPATDMPSADMPETDMPSMPDMPSNEEAK